jgi:hypothetical protein
MVVFGKEKNPRKWNKSLFKRGWMMVSLDLLVVASNMPLATLIVKLD